MNKHDAKRAVARVKKEGTPKPKKVGTPKLTQAQWAEAEALWETGEYTLKDLSDKFGIRPESMSRGLKSRGSVKGSASVKEEIKKAVAEAASEDPAARAAKIKEVKDRHERFNGVLFGLMSAKLTECKRAGLNERTIEPDINALLKCAKLNEMIRAERYILLGIDDGDDDEALPDIVVRNLTAGETDRIRRMNEQHQKAEEDELDQLAEIEREIEDMEQDQDGSGTS